MKQEELIPLDQKEITPDISRQGPLLWVKALRVYSDLKPDKKPLCDIKLRPGMNILWAKPADTSNIELGQSGISGHSAGKTLFCRLIRYMLGESTFGNEDVRQGIRDKFLNGTAIAEVVVNQISWLVIRPLGLSGGHHAVRNCSIDHLFDNNLEKNTFNSFKTNLNNTIRNHLAIKEFPTTKKNIDFDHILPWLSRDQECRMNHVAKWRATESDSNAPIPDVADNCHIIRGILNLLSFEEEYLISKHEKMKEEKNNLEKAKPLRKYYFERLKKSLPLDLSESLKNNFHLGNLSDSIDKIIKDYEKLHKQALDELNSPEEHNPFVAQSLENWQLVKSKMDVKYSEIKEQKRLLARDLGELRILTKTPRKGKKLAWAEMRKTVAPGRCNTPLALAIENGCILAQKHTPDHQSCQNILEGSKAKIEKYQESIRETRAYIKQLSREFKALNNQEKQARSHYDSVSQQANAGKNKIAEKLSQYIIKLNRLNDLSNSYSQMEKTKNDYTNLESDLRKSLEEQKKLRKKENTEVLNSIFSKIIQDVLEPEIQTKIIMEADSIKLITEYHGSVSSTAVEAIKIIAFDFAALCLGLEDNSGHPGFLMHDSPREADMGADIYQRFFMFIKQHLEDKYPKNITPSFQYIITTTEPPPLNFQKMPWLIEPVLDASTAQGRLLGVDL